MVTGLAFYQLQHELTAVTAQREEIRLKAAKDRERVALMKTESERQRYTYVQLAILFPLNWDPPFYQRP